MSSTIPLHHQKLQQQKIELEQQQKSQLRQPKTPVLSSSNYTLYSTASSLSPSKNSFDEQRINNILNSNNKLIGQKNLSLSNLTDGSPKIINKNHHGNISVFTQPISTALSSDKSLNTSSNNRIRKTFGRLCVFNPLKQLQLIHCNAKNRTSMENINVQKSDDATKCNASNNVDCPSTNGQHQKIDGDNEKQTIKMESEQNSIDKSVLIGSHKKLFKSTSVDYYV